MQVKDLEHGQLFMFGYNSTAVYRRGNLIFNEHSELDYVEIQEVIGILGDDTLNVNVQEPTNCNPYQEAIPVKLEVTPL